MLKIGIIGLGEIATKAYLPVIGRKNLEVHLCTRNEKNLSRLGDQYRFENRHHNLDSLIHAGIKAAFVHTSTASHYSIIEHLLENNIHVYVDKPVTDSFESTQSLVELANKKSLTLMAGFNRRYAPAYAKLKELKNPNMIVMQKNRKSLPGEVRTFVFDDFIHVLDTLLFLFPHPVEHLTVIGKKTDTQLHHVVVQFNSTDGITAIGIMNRDSGTVEEKLEVYTPDEKWVVNDVSETIILRDKNATRPGVNDWESTLHKRGFEQIVEVFLQMVKNGTSPSPLHQDLLQTHKLCERVVEALV